MSCEAWVNVPTLPSRKFAHACWNVLVPVGRGVVENVNVPVVVSRRVLGLLVAVAGDAELERVAALDPRQVVEEVVIAVVLVIRSESQDRALPRR